MTLSEIAARARTSEEAEAHKRRVMRVSQIMYDLRERNLSPASAKMMLENAGVSQDGAARMVEGAKP
jgi:hypothetical protein